MLAKKVLLKPRIIQDPKFTTKLTEGTGWILSHTLPKKKKKGYFWFSFSTEIVMISYYLREGSLKLVIFPFLILVLSQIITRLILIF